MFYYILVYFIILNNNNVCQSALILSANKCHTSKKLSGAEKSGN